MKILIVSDTHRRDGNLREIIEKQSPFDMLIHLGDTEGSEAYFKEWVNNDNCVIRVVRGNNDFFSQTDREKEISIGKYRAFLAYLSSWRRSRKRREPEKPISSCSDMPTSRIWSTVRTGLLY